MEVSTLRQRWKESVPVYVTIACIFTALIGGGWFILSYLKGDTVLNNQSIVEYTVSDHPMITVNKASISPPLTFVSSEEIEEEEELEEEEFLDESEELDEDEFQANSYNDSSNSFGNTTTGTVST